MTEERRSGSQAPQPVAHRRDLAVGRGEELAHLSRALRDASAGDPSVILVRGEAGIGKSWLLRQAARSPEAAAMQVAFGRFVEGSPETYLPFSTALVDLCRTAGILDDPRQGPGLPLRRFAEGETATFVSRELAGTLQSAFWWALKTLQLRRPVLFVFDDLHAGSEPALQAIARIVSATSDLAITGTVNLCILLAARPEGESAEADRLIAMCRREPIFEEMELAPMAALDVGELALKLTGGVPPQLLLDRVVRASRGIPMLAIEILDRLSRDPERGSLDVSPGLVLPTRLSTAFAERMAGLAGPVDAVLCTAALLDEPFDSAVLAEAFQRPVDGDLQDAEAAGLVVREQAGGWRFVHPVARQVAAGRLTGSPRMSAHLALAQALRGGSAPAIVVGHHLLEAGPLAAPGEAGHAAVAAGRADLEQGAYAEAVRFFESAIANDDYFGLLSGPERGAILFEAGFAQWRHLSSDRAQELFLQSIDQFSEAGDFGGWSRAMIGLLRVATAHGRLGPVTGDVAQRFLEFAEQAREKAPEHLAGPLAAWGQAMIDAARPEEAEETAKEALALGERHGDNVACLEANVLLGRFHQLRLRPAAALDAYRESERWADRVSDQWYRTWTIFNQPSALFSQGRLDEAWRSAQDVKEFCEEIQDWAIQAFAVAAHAAIAAVRGDLDLAEELGGQVLRLYRRSNYPFALAQVLPPLAHVRMLAGNFDQATEAVDMLGAVTGPRPAWAQHAAIRAFSGGLSALRAEIQADPARVSAGSRIDMFSMAGAMGRVELAELLDDPALLRYPVEICREASAGGSVITFGPSYLVDRVLALGSFLDSTPADAMSRLRDVADSADALGARVEAARARLDFARIALANRRESTGGDLLRSAISSFDGMRLRAIAERARTLAANHGIEISALESGSPYPGGLSELHFSVLVELARGTPEREVAGALLVGERTVLGALRTLQVTANVVGQESARRYLELTGRAPVALTAMESRVPSLSMAETKRAFLFTDVVDSTPVNVALGDREYVELLARHDLILRAALARNRGEEVLHEGDSIFAAFDDARSAVNCAVEIQRDFPIYASGAPGIPLHIRVGVHSGTAVHTGGDYLGIAVTTAARIRGHAHGGQVLVSEAVRSESGAGFTFTDRGRFPMKGFADLVRLYEATARN